jgi:hypothetical protein
MGQRHRKRTKLGTSGTVGNPLGTGITGNNRSGGGYGTVQKGAKTASGNPMVNPFVIPKQSGLTQGSWVYPSYYYQTWDILAWRNACDQAIKMGYTESYATLTTWAYERSPFIQSLFYKLGFAFDKIKFFIAGDDGKEIPELTELLCNKPWQLQLRREILFSHFWGFSGLNFDPGDPDSNRPGAIYKYPQQQIDPINRMLKANTFAFYDGMLFDDNDNLLFVQPSTNYEAFLGWMQPITSLFVEMNVNSNNWVSAGRRLAFPVMTVGYPQDDGSLDANGQPQNNYKQDAVNFAANIDPTQAQVYPYTIDQDGNIIKSVLVEFEKPGAAASLHKIYQEFNETCKGEIELLIFGRAITQPTGRAGNRALGEVEERAVDDRIAGLAPYVKAVLNNDVKRKFEKFYTNLPDGWHFGYNTSKQLTFADMQIVSAVANENGYKLTEKFFADNGISSDFLEKLPAPQKDQIVKPDQTFNSAMRVA